MLNMFEGNMDNALAAYNGGAGNVKKWTISNIGTLTEDFSTAITFRETQEYITKVWEFYAEGCNGFTGGGKVRYGHP